jgi:multiple sugar transport system permease protein
VASGRARAARAAWTIGGFLIVGVIAFPAFWMIVLAFDSNQAITVNTPVLFPRHVTAANFTAAWHLVNGTIMTSVVVATAAMVLSLLIAVPAAYGLAQFSFRLAAGLVLAVLAAQMIPGISLSLTYYTTFHQLHLLGSYPGLVLADTTYGVPYCVILLRAFMAVVPRDLLDAARIDGCGEWRVFRSVAVPLALPGIVTAALFAFLFAWGDFLFSLTLNAGSNVQPFTLGLYKFVGTYGSDWGGIMAAVVLAAVPATVFLIVAQRWVTAGIRTGALTG